MDKEKAEKMSKLHRKVADTADYFLAHEGLSIDEVKTVLANLWKAAEEAGKEKPDLNYIG
jgi:hypothetical protein